MTGALKTTIKQADHPGLDQPLTATGQFVFDTARDVVLDQQRAWVAVDEGVMSWDLAKREFVRWHRLGSTSGGNVPLGKIVRMGWHDDTGNRVPSDRVRDGTAQLYATDDAKRIWRWDADHWQQVTAAPFQTERGPLLARSPRLDVYDDGAGALRMSLRQSTIAATEWPPVLVDGRLTVDRVRDLAFHQDKMFWLTKAGIMQTDSNGGFEYLWHISADDKRQDLNDLERLVSSADGQLLAVNDDGAWKLQDTKQWLPVSIDDSMRKSTEVMFADDFWQWSRWNGKLHTEVFSIRSDGRPLPLVDQGTFSFDAIRSFAIHESEGFATTLAGIVRFKLDDLKVIAIDQVALDADTGRDVPLSATAQFVSRPQPVCTDERYHFEWNGERWARYPGKLDAADWKQRYADDRYIWQATPIQQGSQRRGLQIDCTNSTSGVLETLSVLPETDPADVRRIMASGSTCGST